MTEESERTYFVGMRPDALRDNVHTLAREAGWTAPWDREEQKKAAGKKSGVVRGNSWRATSIHNPGRICSTNSYT